MRPFIKENYKQKAQTSIPAQRRSDMSRSPDTGRMYTADAAQMDSLGQGIFINPGAPLTPFSLNITTARTTTRGSTAGSIKGGNPFNFGKQIVQDFVQE